MYYLFLVYIMENRDTVIQEAVHKLFNTPCDNYIFVYTPPKVGSTTLVSSLRISLLVSFSIIHIHDDIMLGVLTGIKNVTVNEIIQFLAQTGKNVYVIDVYRTPIERKMAEFFEKISIYHFNKLDLNMNKYSVNALVIGLINCFRIWQMVNTLLISMIWNVNPHLTLSINTPYR